MDTVDNINTLDRLLAQMRSYFIVARGTQLCCQGYSGMLPMVLEVAASAPLRVELEVARVLFVR